MESIVMNANKLILITLLSGIAVGQSAPANTPGQSGADSTHVQVKASPAPPLKPSPAKSPFTPKASNAPGSKQAQAADHAKPKAQSAGNPASVKPSTSLAKPAATAKQPAVAGKQNALAAKQSIVAAKPVSIPLQNLKSSKPAANSPVKKDTATASKTAAAPAPAKGPSAVPAKDHAKAVVADAKHPSPGAKPVAVKSAAPNSALKAGKPDAAKTVVKPAVVAVQPPPPASAAAVIHKVYGQGQRDPFVNPIHKGMTSAAAGSCATGKRCLDIEQVVLKGIIKTREGNMALVENAAKRPYVLHENDALFNGTVERITGDTVFFRQTMQDMLGHSTTREVVKKVTAPSV